MRRLIGLIIVAFILITTAFSVYADDVNRSMVIESLDMLKILDIVPDEYNEKNLDVSQKVTRAEFAVYLKKLLNIDMPASGTLYYNDVPKTHYAYEPITVLTELGYFKGTDKKNFDPDLVMKKEHAEKVLLQTLGYGDYLKIKGNTITTVLSNTEIADDTSTSSELLLGDLFIMMKNSLLENRMEMNSVSAQSKEYTEGESLLYYTRKMKYGEDKLLTAAEGADIYGRITASDIVIIGESEYVTSLDNIADFLGHRVNYIYYEPDDEIIWIEENKKTEKLFISADESTSFDKTSSTLSYYSDSSKKKSVKISENVTVIYNGAFFEGSVSEVFNKDRYEVTLISLDGTNKYDLALIYAYENYMVGGKDVNEMVLYDSISQKSISFDPDDYTIFKVVNSNGEKTELSNIPEKSIVSAYVSKDKTHFKAVVSTNSVSGKYNGYDKDLGVTVDGKIYKFYDKNKDYEFLGAKTLTLLIDFKGYVVYADVSYVDKNQFVGYAYKALCSDGDYGQTIHIKVLNENGSLESYNVYDTLVLDGTRYKDMNVAYEQFYKEADGDFMPQIMCFTKNEEGKIIAIDRSSEHGGKNVLVKNQEQPVTSNPYIACFKITQNRIGKNMLVNADTKVFFVPKDEDIETADENNFTVGKPVENQGFSGAVSYKISDNEVFYEQYIVSKQAATKESFTNSEGFFVVDKISQKVNSDDEVSPVLVGMQHGKKLELLIDEDIFSIEDLDIKSGDVLRIAHNRGVLNNATVIYSYGQAKPVAIAADDPIAEVRYVSGYAHSKEGTVFKFGFNDASEFDEIIDTASYSGNIMVYDSDARSGKVYKGTLDDLKTWKTSGEGSFVVVQTYNLRVPGVVIYK